MKTVGASFETVANVYHSPTAIVMQFRVNRLFSEINSILYLTDRLRAAIEIEI